MYRKPLFLILLFGLINTPLVYAVTEANIWLPKRYTIAKHKLLSTAVEAERTERCVKVTLGEMSVEKTTPAAYYFIITCRDKNQVSYNLSYTYPVNGAMPILVNEQQVVVKVAEEEEVEVPTISADEAWPLCVEEVKQKTRTMLEVQIVEDNPSPSAKGLAEQVLDIPFDAKNPQGLLLRYKAICTVDVDKKLTMKLSPR